MSSGDYLVRDKELDLGWETVTVTMKEIDKLKKELQQAKDKSRLWQQAAGQAVERLHSKTEILEEVTEQLHQAKQLLRKCSPYSSGGANYWVSICNHCDSLKEDGHKKDCEYIKMIGGGEG